MKAAVVGDPVSHSLSPRLFRFFSRSLDVPLEYGAVRVPEGGLPAAVESFRSEGYCGLSVTRPHKQAAFALAGSKDEAASACGAVNALAFSNGAVAGHNTDVPGFLDGLELAGFSPRGKSALVVGAGGAARAVAFALSSAGAAVTICARRPEAAKALAAGLGVSSGEEAPSDLIVNCTPLGWNNGEPSPIASARCGLAVDLVYGRDTAFLRQARAAGAQTQDGRAMLAAQAARAWEIWLGPLKEGRAELIKRALTELTWD